MAFPKDLPSPTAVLLPSTLAPNTLLSGIGSTCIEWVVELRSWGFVTAGLAEGLLADGLHAEKGGAGWSRTSLSHPQGLLKPLCLVPRAGS